MPVTVTVDHDRARDCRDHPDAGIAGITGVSRISRIAAIAGRSTVTTTPAGARTAIARIAAGTARRTVGVAVALAARALAERAQRRRGQRRAQCQLGGTHHRAAIQRAAARCEIVIVKAPALRRADKQRPLRSRIRRVCRQKRGACHHDGERKGCIRSAAPGAVQKLSHLDIISTHILIGQPRPGRIRQRTQLVTARRLQWMGI